MTSPIVDFSEIDLTGSVKFEDQQIGSVYYNGERLWPFGVDLLYTGGIGGASYLPDPADVYNETALGSFGASLTRVVDEKNGAATFGPERVDNGDFSAATGWSLPSGASISGGLLTIATGGNFTVDVSQAGVIQAGRWYRVRLVISSIAGGACRIGFGGLSSVDFADFGGAGTFEFLRFATSTGSLVIRQQGSGTTLVVDSISVSDVFGIPAQQGSASLRPLLGRAPKERRNQFERTEEFDNAYWSKLNLSVVPNAGIAPNGSETADRLVPNGQVATHAVFKRVTLWSSGGRFTVQAKVKADSYAFFGLAVYNQPYTSEVRYSFNLNTLSRSWSTLSAAPTGIDATIEDIGNGWRLVTATAIFASGTAIDVSMGVNPLFENVFSVGSAGDGVSGVLITEAQLDVGLATPYQRVGFSGDVTEAGVPSYPFVRFDLSDDRLDTVLPQAVMGDVVIAGRNGSVIAPHGYAANSTFQLGPTSYTGGTPGILRAIGDVVGWSILNKTLTAAERERLMRFYKRRGAKGMLVPGGPELISPASAWSGSANWSVNTATGRATLIAASSSSDDLSVGGLTSSQLGEAFLATLTIESISGGSVRLGGSRVFAGPTINTPGTYSAVWAISLAGTGSIIVDVSAGGVSAVVSGLSLRKLLPEEEW